MCKKKRLNGKIDADLHRRWKIAAAMAGITMAEQLERWITEGLRQSEGDKDAEAAG